MKLCCPTCQKPLSTWQVVTSGPLQPRACPACGSQYYANGLELAMLLHFIVLLIGFRVLPGSIPEEFSFGPFLGLFAILPLASFLPPRALRGRWKTIQVSALLLFASGLLLVLPK